MSTWWRCQHDDGDIGTTTLTAWWHCRRHCRSHIVVGMLTLSAHRSSRHDDIVIMTAQRWWRHWHNIDGMTTSSAPTSITHCYQHVNVFQHFEVISTTSTARRCRHHDSTMMTMLARQHRRHDDIVGTNVDHASSLACPQCQYDDVDGTTMVIFGTLTLWARWRRRHGQLHGNVQCRWHSSVTTTIVSSKTIDTTLLSASALCCLPLCQQCSAYGKLRNSCGHVVSRLITIILHFALCILLIALNLL